MFHIPSKDDLPLDIIRIEKIRVSGKHGVTEAEREKALPLEVSVELLADLTRAAQSDEIDDTINYSRLHKEIISVVENKSRHLLERLALDIIEAIFVNKRIRQAKVCISKPDRLSGATPSVTLVRRNGV
jgi:dihydroneopterin aldolase